MSSETTPKYLQVEEASEWKELISTLPRDKGWLGSNYMYLYRGCWFIERHLQGVLSWQKHFVAQDSDIFLVTYPKSGTTWLKSIMFTLLNRKRYPVGENQLHPLLTHNPHELVPFLHYDTKILGIASSSSPRLFAAHLSYVSLPESVQNSTTSKIVYLCRNPKDTLVSHWHFANKLRPQKNSIGECLEMFCNGVSPYGPYWDHVLEYWKQSRDNPDRVLFLKYEDMKEQPGLLLRGLARFLGCAFSADEEESGLVKQILNLCSFDHLSGLEVNKNGILSHGIVNNAFFRRGEVGDWKNYFDAEMDQSFDRFIQEKFRGSGLVL